MGVALMNLAMPQYRRGPVYGTAARAPMVCWLDECRRDSVPLVGGKCSSLGELINAGVRVPPGFAITTEGYRRFMEEGGIDRVVKSLLTRVNVNDLEGLERVSLEIRAVIEGQPFPEEMEDLVAERYRKLSLLSCLPAVPVAVRSSATAEDLAGASFAGQQDTFLWVRGVDEVLRHIRRCISSLYTGRAISYRANRAYFDEEMAMSVGVQKMANSFTAGVMFTLDPATGDRSVVVIDSNYGFGESVVSGEVTPDNFVVNKVTLEILKRTVSRKELFYTVDTTEQRTQSVEVPPERQTVQSLMDDEITELAWMGKQIEKLYGQPMDIEWAVDKDLPFGGNIFILQARPETVWSQKQAQPVVTAGYSAMDHILSSLLQGKRLR